MGTVVYTDEAQDAVHLLTKARDLLGYHGENWNQGDFAIASDGTHVEPVSERACSWCLTGAFYKVFDNPDIYHSNRRMEYEVADSRIFPVNELLHSALCDGLQEMADRKRITPETEHEMRENCYCFEDVLACFNDNVSEWETVKEFLDYSMAALRLKIDHIRHWQGEQR